MSEQPSNQREIDKLLRKAEEPAKEAMRLHAFYHGKMGSTPKCPVRDFDDFAIWYSPGVAAPCRAIADAPERVYELTNKGNTVAVISDGSRVLGLGDIGPEAGLPVMEGKALLYKYLGGVDAVPVMLENSTADEFVKAVLRLQPGFGGINLEDIAHPKCFSILERLQKEARIPVWHDDQQGTATVTLAGLMNALKVVGKRKEDVRITFIGIGAAGVAVSRLIFAWGVNPANALMLDSKGIIGKHRSNLMEGTPAWHLSKITNSDNRKGGIQEALEGADVVIALSTPGPGIILPEWVKTMAKNPIVFACANPVPEIWPWEAADAGAAVVATGRSDFPNQVNNSLSFPGIFRGVLDVRASSISDEMCLAAAEALAGCVGENLSPEYIIPPMTNLSIYPIQAAAVGLKAQEQGLARIELSREQLLRLAEEKINAAQREMEVLMSNHCIPPVPGD